MNPDRNHPIVIVSGFRRTGSSAVLSVLKEFGSFHIVEKEFKLLDPRIGLYDIIRSVRTGALDVSILSQFRKRLLDAGKRATGLHRLTRTLVRHLGMTARFPEFPRSSYELVFNGAYRTNTKAYLDALEAALSAQPVPADAFVLIKRITNDYLQSLCAALAADEGTVVLNQTIRPNDETQLGLSVLDTSKLIVVDRDPRDQYIDLTLKQELDPIMERKPWRGPPDQRVKDFIRWYRNRRNKFYRVSKGTERLLVVRFEDLVLRYETTVQSLCAFLGCDPSIHRARKQWFDPDKLKHRVGMWRSYHDQDQMQLIHDELREFCHSG
jgi:hypothetical protein